MKQLPALKLSILHPCDTIPTEGDRSHHIPYHSYAAEREIYLSLLLLVSSLWQRSERSAPLPLPAPTELVRNMLQNT